MRKGCKKEILIYLKEKDEWVHKGTLERECINSWGYLADTCDRGLRLLSEDGTILKEKRASKGMWYKAKPKPQVVIEENEQGKLFATFI